jgi:hypothetical protein
MYVLIDNIMIGASIFCLDLLQEGDFFAVELLAVLEHLFLELGLYLMVLAEGDDPAPERREGRKL